MMTELIPAAMSVVTVVVAEYQQVTTLAHTNTHIVLGYDSTDYHTRNVDLCTSVWFGAQRKL